MAKRFTDSSKYKKPFFRKLSPAYKLFWDYLYHECDHAGFWIVDFDMAQLMIDKRESIVTYNYKDTLEALNKDETKIIPIKDGEKWFIPSFIEFQYGQLNPKNRVHKSVIQVLKKNDIDFGKLTINDKEYINEPNLVEVKKFSDLDQSTFYNVRKLKNIYLADKELVKLVAKSTKRKVSDFPYYLDVFLENILSLAKLTETPSEFAKYFRNWLKYQEIPTKQQAGLDYNLLTTQERFSLSAEEQLKLVKQRSK